MVKRQSSPLLTSGVVSSGRRVGGGRGRWEGKTGPGVIRTTFKEVWGFDEVGGDGGKSTVDTGRGGDHPVRSWCT